MFGDGSAALAVVSGDGRVPGPRVLKSASHIITDAIEAMRDEWDRDRLPDVSWPC
ncbi:MULTISPECIES: hypothetical protein [unclassified Streptomyces]|uniref:hypothetical protein n=1 Tax=unclassified Streptomyces TaxID=2593676 RepID=UPI00363A7AD8